MAATSAIHGYLAEVRRGHVWVYLLRTTGLLTGTCAGLLLVALLLAPALEHVAWLRIGVSGVLAAVLVWWIGRLYAFLRSLRDAGAVARLVGRARPRLRSDLLSVVELTRQPDHPFAPSLVEALAQRTWRRLRARRPRSLVDVRPLRPAAAVLAATALAWILAMVLGPDRLLHAARMLAGRVPDPPRVAHEGLVRDLTLRYVYPPYMNRPEQQVTGSTGDISAPPGTSVYFSAGVPQGLRGAQVVLRPGEFTEPVVTPLAVKDMRRLQGAITVERQGTYHFEVRALDGRLLRDPGEHRVDVEPDLPPRVALQGPPDHLEVNVLQHVDLAYAADDDFGLSRIELVYQQNGGASQRLTLWTPRERDPQRRTSGQHDWDLAALGFDADAGGRLAYWLEVRDNDTVSGPKTARSDAKHLVLFSAVERHGRTRAQQEALLEDALRLLADRLLAPAAGSEPDRAAAVQAFRALHERQDRLVDSVTGLLRTMRDDGLVPRVAVTQIGNALKRLRQLLVREKRLVVLPARMAGQPKAPGPRQVAAMAQHNQATVAELERDVLLVAALLDEQQLQTLTRTSQQLTSARRRVSDMLEEYRRTKEPQLLERLLGEITRMQQRLHELHQQLAQLRTAMPDEYLNPEAIERLDLAASLRKLRAQLEHGRLDDLQAGLSELQRKLNRMDQLLAQNLDAFRSGRMPARERALNGVLERLHELESEQRLLAKRSGGLVRRYRQRASHLMRTDVEPRSNELREIQTELRRRLDEADHRHLEAYPRDRLQQFRQWARWIGDALEQRDVDKALQLTERVGSGLRELVEEMREDALGIYLPWRRRQLRTARHVEEARGTAQRLQHALEQLLPQPAQLMQAPDRHELQRQRQRQHALRARLQELLRASADGAEESLLLEETQQAALAQADALMRDATQRLRRARPQEAQDAQQEAAKKIAEARQSLRHAREPGRIEGDRARRSRIEIPGAEAFVPPKAFRQDILDAMKEKPPEPYRPQVGQYYRELVR